MRNTTQAASWAAVVLASLGVHALAFGGLGQGGAGAAGAPRRRAPTTVEMTVAPPQARPPLPTAPRPVAARPRLAVARPAARLRAAEARPPAAEPPAAAEALADFTGQTLTNDGASWSSATGNGQKMNGPIGRPGARVSHRVVDGTAGGTGSGPPIVGLGDLSRTPVAPELSDKLAAAYPPVARAKGIEGKAMVKARITPEGQVRDLAIVLETAPGFGAACQATLRASVWTPPLDRDGRAVSTIVNYTCRFKVQ